MAELQDLNENVLEKLRKLGGEKFVGEMLALFLKHVPGKVAAAVAGANAGDFAVVEAAVHSVKSSSGNIGAERVFDIANRIELLEGSEVEKFLPSLIIELEESFSRLRGILEKVKKGTKA
ncbi:MAG: Hpt domain-containing protein [Candidatus Marinimicrobia bacterium]|nr:Hpt domain-containing protein [Candidatus Neomarinimicrobiota bacterium]